MIRFRLPSRQIALARLVSLRRSLPPLSRWQRRPRPLFGLFRHLLETRSELTLGEVLDQAREQSTGLLVLLLALPSLVPGLNVGAAPIGGTAIMAIGVQMTRGRVRPWLPQRLRRQVLHKGKIEAALARLESLLDRLRRPAPRRRALNLRWTGALIVWVGFLLALPVPLPFANILPAAVLCLTGAALVEERPGWGWLGVAAALGTSTYFAASFRLVLAGLHTLLAGLGRALA